MKSDYKSNMIQLVIAVAGVFAALFAVIMFNRYLLMELPLYARMVLLFVLQWLPAIAPVIIMLTVKDKLSGFGFYINKAAAQVLTGFVIAAVMSALLTVIPIMLGMKDWVGSYTYTEPWKFIYELFLCVFGVALAEEFIFRGFVFHKLLKLKDSKPLAIIVSSALFGLFHIFGGNLLQVIMTALMGAFFCLCREKIRYCSTLSLIVAHGVYDALIVLWTSVL